MDRAGAGLGPGRESQHPGRGGRGVRAVFQWRGLDLYRRGGHLHADSGARLERPGVAVVRRRRLHPGLPGLYRGGRGPDRSGLRMDAALAGPRAGHRPADGPGQGRRDGVLLGRGRHGADQRRRLLQPAGGRGLERVDHAGLCHGIVYPVVPESGGRGERPGRPGLRMDRPAADRGAVCIAGGVGHAAVHELGDGRPRPAQRHRGGGRRGYPAGDGRRLPGQRDHRGGEGDPD